MAECTECNGLGRVCGQSGHDMGCDCEQAARLEDCETCNGSGSDGHDDDLDEQNDEDDNEFDDLPSDEDDDDDDDDDDDEDGEPVAISSKPVVKLSGQNGNVFNLLGKCVRALLEAGLHDEADALKAAVFAAGSYDEALQLMMTACEVR